MYGKYGKYTKGKDICNCTEEEYHKRRKLIPGYPYTAPCCVDVKRNMLRMFAHEMDKHKVGVQKNLSKIISDKEKQLFF